MLSCLRLREGGAPLRFIGCYLSIALYGACSSLTLVGYVWIAAGALWTLGLAVAGSRKKQGIAPALRVGGGVLVLSCVYLASNMDLLRTLAGKGFSTHRQEMVLRAAEHPAEVFGELLLSGGSYSPVYSTGILTAAVLLTLAAAVLWVRSRRRVRNLRRVWALTGLIFCGAVLAVLWNCGPMVSLRLSLGGAVTYFQADRVYWCFPFLWMLVLGLILEGICGLGECPEGSVQPRQQNAGEHIQAGRGLRRSILLWVCCLLLLGIEGIQVLRDSTLNKNFRLMLFEDYEQVTWESIYMEDVFARIEQAIGPEKEGYSVVSLGIHPSVALYHGYTCADGYSNNYDLAYKHRFRQIMAGELEKNDETRRYFDEWGNRLYLAGIPYGINGMVPKGQPGYTDLDYDLDAMSALHIRYLLAAAPVEEIEEIVHPCGLGKSKARDISACMKQLQEVYGGKVPDDFDALLKLPGVGRKSANLIMGDVFGKPAIVTDTHCIRLCNRIGLVDNIKEPKKVEMALWKIVPPEEGSDFCHRLVYHGREVCTARTTPYCDRCCLQDICKKNI